MNKLMSACGLDCFNCPCFLATRSEDQSQKMTVASKWSTDYKAELTVADINCDGCMSGNNHFFWCYECPIRNCVVRKNYRSCAECDEFPCKLGQFLFNEVPQARLNIENLRSE